MLVTIELKEKIYIIKGKKKNLDQPNIELRDWSGVSVESRLAQDSYFCFLFYW